MTASLEGGGEELVHNLLSHLVVNKASRHNEHVSIVVLTDEVCNLRNPAQSSTYLLVLIQGDADTLTAATDGNARITSPLSIPSANA